MATLYTPINDVKATLTSAHAVGDGVLVVDSVTLFGTPTTGAPVRVTVIRQADGQYAIFGVTGVNVSTNSLTIGSVLEGTTDISFAVGDSVEVEITAGTIQDIHDTLGTVVHNTGNETIAGQKTFTGLMTVDTSSATATGIVVQGSTSQSANLQEWRDINGNLLASLDPTGSINLNVYAVPIKIGVLPGAGLNIYPAIWIGQSAPDFSNYAFLGAGTAINLNSSVTFAMKIANVPALLLDGSGGAARAIFGYAVTSSSGDTLAMVTVLPANAIHKGLVIQAVASQSANLQEWQDGVGTVLGAIKPDASWLPPQMADSVATNNSVYYSTTSSKLVYKDSAGVVNALY